MRRLLTGWWNNVHCFCVCCCRSRELLRCLAPQPARLSSPFICSGRLGATATETGTRGVRANSGASGDAARQGGPCCAASPGSMWSGWATRPASSWSTGRPWQGARRGAPVGKSRDTPPGPSARVCSLASPRRAAPARCCPERRSASGPANLDLSQPSGRRLQRPAPSSQPSARCRHRDAMERLDKAALNALQPPEFR